MSGWDALEAELDRWAGSGRAATFWWRDDDAAQPTPALSTAFELSRRFGVPLGLAVVPADCAEGLGSLVARSPGAVVLQHGYSHANHAPSGEKAAEYGAHRPAGIMSAELGEGAKRLGGIFAGDFLPLLVPPWNRISERLIRMLPEAGFIGLSTFGPRPENSPIPGLRQVNTHVDLIDWRGGRRFKGTAHLAEDIAAHLAARRQARADPAEPTGILSHHLDHDPGCWRFLEQLFTRTCGRENVRWLSATEALET